MDNASYFNDRVNLVISIDGGSSDKNLQTKKVAKDFNWNYGEKKVIYYEENLGLRKHIIKCGDLSQIYGNIIILEDDLFVSKIFYKYAKKAIEYFYNCNNIAGISLYAQRFNETARKRFEPLYSNYDNYFIQLASSWGQAWTSNQWLSFKKWYDKNKNNNIKNNVPRNIKVWPESSWKKYFIKYMLDQNKFFVYPYISLVTNMGDVGTNTENAKDILQVPICIDDTNDFRFIKFKDTIAKYDVYHENIYLKELCESKNKEKCIIDIYGEKDINNYDLSKYKYILTTKNLNKKITKSYGLKMFPHDQNIIFDVKGKEIFLYNLNIKKRNDINYTYKKYKNLKYYYFNNGIGLKKVLYYSLFDVLERVKSKFLNIKKDDIQ